MKIVLNEEEISKILKTMAECMLHDVETHIMIKEKGELKPVSKAYLLGYVYWAFKQGLNRQLLDDWDMKGRGDHQ